MIPKKGYVATIKNNSIIQDSSIAIPDIAKNSNEHLVIGFGIDTKSDDIKIGDVVVFEIDASHTINMGKNGTDIFFRRIETAVAIVGKNEQAIEQMEPPVIHDISANISAIGDKIVITRSIHKSCYKVGDLFIPYERRELGRAQNGTILSISKECSDKTGFIAGMQVLYDYNASFGHEHDFDIVKEENVFCAISSDEEKSLNIEDDLTK